jgi:hypothetical protein
MELMRARSLLMKLIPVLGAISTTYTWDIVAMGGGGFVSAVIPGARTGRT